MTCLSIFLESLNFPRRCCLGIYESWWMKKKIQNKQGGIYDHPQRYFSPGSQYSLRSVVQEIKSGISIIRLLRI